MKWKIKGDYLVIRIPLAEMEEAILEAGTAEWNEPVKKPKPPKEPPPVQHTPECIELRKAELIYARQWPAHCRTCGAKGYIDQANGQKRHCPRCLEFGLCARCGNSALRKVSTEDGTYMVCENDQCQWDQSDALRPSAIVAGLASPVWRCTCEQEAQNA